MLPFLFHFLPTDRVYDDRITYTTVRPNIPLAQEQLILLQEEVKRGIISVDEAVEQFKQWQNNKSRLEASQQVEFSRLLRMLWNGLLFSIMSNNWVVFQVLIYL